MQTAFLTDYSSFVRIFMSGWEASPGHRRNLLDREVTETGIGVARAPGASVKYVAVQEFGRPASARYGFSIDNRSEAKAGYLFDGQHRWVTPHSTVTLTTCATGELVFDRDIAPGGSAFSVRPGATYVLSPAARGVRIEVERRAGAAAPFDQD